MWEPLQIERDLEEALVRTFGEADGKAKFGDYTSARTKLNGNLWEEIKRAEPNLTDHGPRHIADVLNQAHQIIPTDHLNAREMLALMLSILYHDTGNIHGRTGHEKRISDVYDYVVGTPTPSSRLQEKKIVLAVVGSHGGEARDGGKDTIRELNPSGEPFLRQTIRMREIAAILRFADELAEGSQRTSEYLRRTHAFNIDSEKYHDYASITEVCIDPGNERIALTYHINLSTRHGEFDIDEVARLDRLLTFVYHRIRKLDEERQYARFYSSALGVFKRTSATLHFWLDGQQIDLGLEPLELTDLVVPGGNMRTIPEINVAYNIESILTKLKDSCFNLTLRDDEPTEVA
ncbi:MAG: hypothetical protein SGI77_13960 [Pirellulaceae bacterium]|nr:hypothetical protein [Pirellulaceae bacterium]